MKKRLQAKIIVTANYGVVTEPQNIEFDDICPFCGSSGLTIKENSYCSNEEFYVTDNIYCPKGCQFKYDDLINLVGFSRP